MVTGAYSSILVAAPILGMLKRTDKSWEARNIPRAVGEPLRDMVMGAGVGSRREREVAADDSAPTTSRSKAKSASADADAGAPAEEPAAATTGGDAKSALSHPPRPRKKKRR